MSGIYVALDVEATGMDPERDEVIEIAAIKFRDDRVLDRWESLVRPRAQIPFNITSLTGIGAKDVRRAPVFAAVMPRLRDFVRNYPIVGQSPEFDLQMLAASGLNLQNPLYDTFKLATILIPDLRAYNLSTIAARLGVSVPHQHRAMADVETTMAVFLGLYDILHGYDPETLSRLSAYTRAAGSPLARLIDDAHREVVADDGAAVGSIAAQLIARTGGIDHGPEVMFLLPRERPPRLEPAEEGQPTDPGLLRHWTGPGGALARAFPDYEPRPQQVEMMTTVMEALNDGGQYLMEAGTGTGKSLAYLLPSILHAVEYGEPVVISTATIALQDQLFRKDLPDLRRTLKAMARDDPRLARAAEFEAALLKGRGNYLCLRRWFLAQREAAESPEQASLHAKVLTWVQQTETGDRAELHLSPDEQTYWSRLAEVEGSCVPGRCLFHRRNQCFLFRARHKAESAHVIVVNHALLLSDMLAANTVLPPYRNLIIDEAHNLEEEATTQLGFGIGRARVVDLLEQCLTAGEGGELGGVLGSLWKSTIAAPDPVARGIAERLRPRLDDLLTVVRSLRAEADVFFHRLADFSVRYQEGRSDYDHRLRLTTAVRHDPGWSEVERAWEGVAQGLRTVVGALSWAASEWDAVSEESVPGHDELATELELHVRTGHEILERTLAAVSEPSGDTIYWLSKHATTGETGIQAAPLHVGDALREHLFSRCRASVLTSATLTIDGSFAYIRDRLGLEAPIEVRVPSPFNYRESTLLYLAEDMPEPGQPGYQRELQEALVDLCRATRGRAMVLFTSHSALQATYRAIKRPLEAEGILVLGQRLDGSPRQLVERLKSHPETVLLGTNSFWQGVDVVGDALSLLVISKLPFSVPNDPVFAARSELVEDPFRDYAIPQAVLRFKQGFGRLIRSSADRGVCVVLDRRIVSRRYGNSFVRSLPDCTVEIGPAADLPGWAAQWLEPRAAEASAGRS
ncbi:MAG TPA: helicase C-terminal domain-containing protein [Thermomicrobiaceae bacterium]|nr:helicase C-terminal domain-containing protein [Thermomicrobiaceae bacterium]